jgi:hypothetical protein
VSVGQDQERREAQNMEPLALPSEVEAVLDAFRTCELTTIAKDGTPLTWPITALFEPETGNILLTTSIGFPQKALNVRRNPCVSLLYSNQTGSGLSDAPAVLVQGDASVSDEIITSPARNKQLHNVWLHIMRFQPSSPIYRNDPLSHALFDWYFMRLLITVTPRVIRWWEKGDFARTPHILEVKHVG